MLTRRETLFAAFAAITAAVLPKSKPPIVLQTRAAYIYPPIFHLESDITISDDEITRSSGDILELKYQDGLDQVIKAEDEVWLNYARRSRC